MKITCTGRKVNLKDAFIQRVETKLAKLDKFFSDSAEANVTVTCLLYTSFAKCCNPLPGDDIIGFITRGFGVSIHKRSCSCLLYTSRCV